MVCQREGGVAPVKLHSEADPVGRYPPHRDRLGHLRAEGGK